jgi:hypothetical protein
VRRRGETSLGAGDRLKRFGGPLPRDATV